MHRKKAVQIFKTVCNCVNNNLYYALRLRIVFYCFKLYT